jgi:murein DD-endopeptidase MepM/ murein hydrolase activator NlpD
MVATAAFGLVTVWAVAATWLAYDARQTAGRLVVEKAEMRTEYEGKVRALVRRMVGVASHQTLEQDGLDGRLTDLIARQEELENRQNALTRLAEQAGVQGLPVQMRAGEPAGNAPAAVTNRKPPEPPAAEPGIDRSPNTKPAVPTLRLGPRTDGNPPTGTNGSAAAGQRSSVAADLTTTRLPGSWSAEASASADRSLPLRDQLSKLATSISRVEAAQLRALDGLSRVTRGQAMLVHIALNDVGLDPKRIIPPVPKGGVGGPLIPPKGKGPADPFTLAAFDVEAGFQELARLRPIVDAVPLRRPLLDGDDSPTSNFGVRIDPFTGASAMHAGMDFRSQEGTLVRATGAGQVVTAGPSGGYGNLVEIDHRNGLTSRYAHLSAIDVRLGQTVAAGAAVGRVGSTGRSTGPHLHYETRVDGTAVDPQRFLTAGAKLLGGPARSLTRSLVPQRDAAELPSALHSLEPP